MDKVSLKKLLNHRDTGHLVRDLEEKLGPAAVFEADGRLVFGPEGLNGQDHPIVCQGRVLGLVRGRENASLISSILSYISELEMTKKSLVREALDKYREISLLYDIAEKISTCLDPEAIGQLVIDGALKLILADRASVMLYNEKTDMLEILSAHGDDLTPGIEVPADFSIMGSVLARGRAEIVNDVWADPRFVEGALKVSSLICAPLKVADKDIGILYITSEETKNYEAKDLDLITALASQSAASIENALLFRTLEQKVRDRTRDLSLANGRLRQEIIERQTAEQQLREELNEAAAYVKNILPRPIAQGPVKTDWRFVPSTSLGGDAFGYFWLDPDNLVIYLLDVSGHGVGAALLSVSVMNLLRNRTLPQADFNRPGQVLAALNNAFPMEKQGGKYFTIWYGVYNLPGRTLCYSSAGHPPAIFLPENNGQPVEPVRLRSPNLFIGGLPEVEFNQKSFPIEEPGRLYIFSDGVFEIESRDGTVWDYDLFVDFIAQAPRESVMDRLWEQNMNMRGQPALEDDFSILEISFA